VSRAFVPCGGALGGRVTGLAKSAGIIIIGDEILSGTFADENASFLIGELRALGVALHRIEFIRDDPGEIADSVRRTAGTCDIVFTSGGVGATHDDVTMTGIAAAFGVDIVRHPELEALVRGHYGQDASPAQLRLADVPAGTVLLLGESKWPVMVKDNVHILPGVPSLFRRCFQTLRGGLQAQPTAVARIYCALEETELAPLLDRIVAEHPAAKFGSYPRFEEREFRVLLTVEAEGAAVANAGARALADALGAAVVRSELADES